VRDRRPGDWVTDLAGRHRLEDEMAAALAGHPELVLARRATHAFDALDFAVLGPGERLAQVELKAKHQPYRGWGHLRPKLAEADLLVLDELALRKIVEAGRYAYLVVADLPSARWCVWSTVDLVLASKIRTVRTLATGTTRLKAKVLLDMREAAAVTASPTDAAGVIAEALDRCDRNWSAIGPWPSGPVIHDPTRRTS
jgi:hypothetical protein